MLYKCLALKISFFVNLPGRSLLFIVNSKAVGVGYCLGVILESKRNDIFLALKNFFGKL